MFFFFSFLLDITYFFLLDIIDAGRRYVQRPRSLQLVRYVASRRRVACRVAPRREISRFGTLAQSQNTPTRAQNPREAP